ncbi:MAG TPA: lipocalin-like domain-containing protein [Anaerolineae bacterium]|nr:lipocalin-like domain-containing protein [Anaerolineae bacterium]
MVRRVALILLGLLLVLVAGLAAAVLAYRHPTPGQPEQAAAGRPVELPRDEAAHFGATTEWWYYTGFLTGKDGRRYGFELVFFKAYVPPQVRVGKLLPLSWLTNPVFFAHLAVSDEAAQAHQFTEQANFPRFWTAGAREDRFDVWNGTWRAWSGDRLHHLQADWEEVALQLDLEPRKPAALHGAGGSGVIDMGPAGTSYYYSYSDMAGTGQLTLDGVTQAVQATAWMDHQWGSWQSMGAFAGWDWLSLRLDDGTQVMLFDFRDEAGNIYPGSAGTWIGADGTTVHLTEEQYDAQVLERWTSPTTGGHYPVRWHVTVPRYGLDVTVAATFPEQEMPIRLGPIYWEGSVRVEGTVQGLGFVEMTGYAPAAVHGNGSR